jgi:hypothetical protein
MLSMHPHRVGVRRRFYIDLVLRFLSDTTWRCAFAINSYWNCLGKIVATASDTKIALEAATASVREKRPLADQADRVEQRSTRLLASHRMNGTTFTNTMKEWFDYQTWVHPATNDTRLVGSQTEAILYVFFDIPCFFSKVELELFLGGVSLNHNVGGALLKMVQAEMIMKTKNRIGTEQFYLRHFGMEALLNDQQSQTSTTGPTTSWNPLPCALKMVTK